MSRVEKISKEKVIPALLDDFLISEEFRKLRALLCKLGGMGIKDPTANANDEYDNSRELASQLTNSIKQQEHSCTVSNESIKNCKSSIKKKRMDIHLNILTSRREQMSSKNKRLNDIAQEQGTSSCLTVYLLNNLDFHYQKQNSRMQSIYDMGFH